MNTEVQKQDLQVSGERVNLEESIMRGLRPGGERCSTGGRAERNSCGSASSEVGGGCKSGRRWGGELEGYALGLSEWAGGPLKFKAFIRAKNILPCLFALCLPQLPKFLIFILANLLHFPFKGSSIAYMFGNFFHSSRLLNNQFPLLPILNSFILHIHL